MTLKQFILETHDLAALAGNPGANGDYPDSRDQDIADWLNVKDVQVYGSLPRAEFAIWAALSGARAAIEDHAANAESPLRSIALTLLDFLRGAAPAIDFGRAENMAALNAWVEAGAIIAAQRDDLLTRSAMLISRAEHAGVVAAGGVVHNLDVARALGRLGRG